MQSRRDQVEAYNYQLARLNSALVRADPDALEPPGRRDTRAFVIGLVVMALALGGVAGWALLFDSGSLAWKEPGTLIVDKSTGSRYLLLQDRLRPVLNLASARLAVGSGVKTASVSTSKLSKVGRGTAIGIQGAPDMLPSLGLLNAGLWRSCLVSPQTPATSVVPAGSTTGKVGTAVSASGLSGMTSAGSPGKKPPAPKQPKADPATLGQNVQLGVRAAADRFGTGRALLVTSAGKEYLIWNDQRLLIEKPWVADILGYSTVDPLPVPAGWLALLPAGPTLEPVTLDGAGRPGPAIGGRATRIGQLVDVRTAGGEARYVVTGKGLAALNETQYALAEAAPGRARAQAISAADLAAVPRDTVPAAQRELPPEPPVLDQSLAAGVPCVEFSGTSAQAAAEVVRATVAPADRPVGGAFSTSVTVPSGGGALVGTVGSAAPKDQPLTLVDDTGTAYALSQDAIQALGYSADEAVYIPAKWLALLPQGPRLTTPGEE